MGIAASLLIFAAGAILDFAITVSPSSVDLGTIGVILMAVGAVGFVVSLFFWASWGAPSITHRQRTVRQPGRTVIEERESSF